MMEDKGTSVGLDKSVDLMKCRLPYLEKQLTDINDHLAKSSLKRRNSTIARLTYHSHRALHIENVSDSFYKSGGDGKPRGRFLVGTGNVQKMQQQMNDELDNISQSSSYASTKQGSRSDTISMLTRSNSMGRYSHRSLSLYGHTYGKQGNVHQHNKNLHNSVKVNSDTGDLPAFSKTFRSKNELQVLDHAKQMLKDPRTNQVNDTKKERINKGISTPSTSASQSLLQTDEHLQSTAQKHIYMCQIPSLLSRGSKARHTIRGYLRTITPQSGSRRLLETAGNYDDCPPPSRGSSPRKPLLVLTENSTLHLQDRYLGKKSYYRSMDSINLSMKEGIPSINIEGSLIPVHMTSKRIM